jgi:hypothetical protein
MKIGAQRMKPADLILALVDGDFPWPGLLSRREDRPQKIVLGSRNKLSPRQSHITLQNQTVSLNIHGFTSKTSWRIKANSFFRRAMRPFGLVMRFAGSLFWTSNALFGNNFRQLMRLGKKAWTSNACRGLVNFITAEQPMRSKTARTLSHIMVPI